jgi:hypothetical protein
MEHHVAGLRALFQRLADNGLGINLEKSKDLQRLLVVLAKNRSNPCATDQFAEK